MPIKWEGDTQGPEPKEKCLPLDILMNSIQIRRENVLSTPTPEVINKNANQDAQKAYRGVQPSNSNPIVHQEPPEYEFQVSSRTSNELKIRYVSSTCAL